MDDLPAGDSDVALSVKHHRRQHHDGRVDEEGEAEGRNGVNGVKANGGGDGRFLFFQLAALHQGGVQVKVVGHDSGPDNADGHVKHPGPRQAGHQQGMTQLPETGVSLRDDEDFNVIADADGGDEHQHDGLDGANAKALQGQEQQDVQSGNDDRPEQGNMEHDVDGDGAAEHLRQIARADGHLAEQPVGPARPARIPIPATLRQVLAGHNAQTGGNDLHENRHQAGQTDHPEKTEFELRAPLQIGAPIARVHVTHADEQGRPDKSPPVLPETGLARRHRHRPVHPLQRQMAGRPASLCGARIDGRRRRHSASPPPAGCKRTLFIHIPVLTRKNF